MNIVPLGLEVIFAARYEYSHINPFQDKGGIFEAPGDRLAVEFETFEGR